MKNQKEATRLALFKCAKERGFSSAFDTARRLLESKQHKDDFNFVSTLHGEICETVLELKLLELAATKPAITKGWSYNKSLILKNRYNINSDFFTEIDLVLFTSACVYLFECKSYSGDKRLVGDGILKREASTKYKDYVVECDVYKQSKIHLDTLMPWVEDFVLPGKLPFIQMCLFDFSLGTLIDERSRAAKLELPCLNEMNVIDFVKEQSEAIWDLKSLSIVSDKLGKVSVKCRDQHLNYVKSLHGKE